MMDWQKAVSDLNQTCRDTFGIPVLYTPQEFGVSAKELIGLFDERREVVTLMGGMETEVQRPVLEVSSVELGITPTKGDQVTIQSQLYRVLEHQPHGQGNLLLMLEKMNDPYATY
uniref:Uncharacterized protein n=1 Tax=Magnetococcus massalia (strain MO-1) TaxID=451514 RepID=A0A1S7LHV8_MAGMO|nr:conserved protein of unknown function [Candidatus Magnetococcus massalia]